MINIYEYTGQDVTIIIVASAQHFALRYLQDKLRSEGLNENEPIESDLMLIWSEDQMRGVIALTDNRKTF